MAQGNTYQNGTVSIGPVIPTGNLDQAGFEALNYTPVSSLNTFPEVRTTSSTASEETLEGNLNFKGVPNFPQFDLSWTRNFTDAGQILMRAAGKTNNCYALKFELQDSPNSATDTNTVVYIGGQIGIVGIPGGGPNDAIREGCNVTCASSELVVDPETI